MSNITVQTDLISTGGFTALREIHLGNKSFRTPTAAMPVGRGAHQDTPAQKSRGVNELYRTVTTSKLHESMRSNSSTIADSIRRDYRKTNPESEVNFVFVSYQDAHQIGADEMEHLVDLVTPYADVLPVPLMPGIVGTINTDDNTRGVGSPAYQSYKSSVERFIETARRFEPETPIMGVIPPLGWEHVRNLLDLYEQHNIKAFCLNLGRRRITAGRQVAMVRPLVRHLARQDLVRGSFTYLINPDPYGQAFTEDRRPAADIAAFGMGIDVLGDCHISPGGFGGDDPQEAPTTFRLFNKETYVYEDVPLEMIEEYLPSDTGFDPDRIAMRSRESPENQLYQMQKLLNMEQIAMAGSDVQGHSRSEIFEHLSRKAGVTKDTQKAYREVRDGFDDGASQAGLSDF
jgi:hypothetical protein